jgi:NAD(P)-dependent dehydrogenase (short-subunit alcohol dehydrogenase family)
VGKVTIKQGVDKILNITYFSASGVICIPLITSYDVYKGELENLKRTFAIPWAKYNIQVNAIPSCALESPMRIPLSEVEKLRKITWIPMERRGTPEDLIEVIIFLSSSTLGFINDHILFIDGCRLSW